MDIQYVGEQLFWGNAGRFALFAAFFSAIFASFAYFRASATGRLDYRQWRSWGRKAFRFHSLMAGLAAFILLYILLSRFYADFERHGFLPIQRRIHVPWQDYVYVDEVSLITPVVA